MKKWREMEWEMKLEFLCAWGIWTFMRRTVVDFNPKWDRSVHRTPLVLLPCCPCLSLFVRTSTDKQH